MNEELDQLLKNLKLRRILDIYDEQLRSAEKEDVSYTEFLTRLMRAQWHARQEHALEWRIRNANLPERWSLDTFPFARQPGVNRKQIRTFAELEFVPKAENIVFIGPTGVGKTGLASGILLKALQNGYRCQFVRAQDLFDDMFVAGRPLFTSTPETARPFGCASNRRTGLFKSQTRTVQHLLQTHGGALSPKIHNHHHEFRI